jgi:L-asparagine transporter-like permease
MWLFPWLTYATLAAIVGILVLMAFSSHHAKEVYGTGGTLAVLIVAALLRHRARGRAAAAAAA